jgi:hypothetical protein
MGLHRMRAFTSLFGVPDSAWVALFGAAGAVLGGGVSIWATFAANKHSSAEAAKQREADGRAADRARLEERQGAARAHAAAWDAETRRMLAERVAQILLDHRALEPLLRDVTEALFAIVANLGEKEEAVRALGKATNAAAGPLETLDLATEVLGLLAPQRIQHAAFRIGARCRALSGDMTGLADLELVFRPLPEVRESILTGSEDLKKRVDDLRELVRELVVRDPVADELELAKAVHALERDGEH